jgi:hypothetical protein
LPIAITRTVDFIDSVIEDAVEPEDLGLAAVLFVRRCLGEASASREFGGS